MAEQKLAMSLDALISQASSKREQKKPRQERKPANAGPRKGLQGNKPKGGGGGGAANGTAQPQQQRQKQQQQQPAQQAAPVQQAPRRQRGSGAGLGVRGGQVKKQVLEVPAHVLRGGPPPQRRQAPFSQQRQPAPEGKWQHDMYEDGPAPVRRAPLSQGHALQPKLIVKNLHHNVTMDDLLELFSTCGVVTSHAINFDQSGRSLGTGYVVFSTREEAVAAKQQYNGVLLDGKAMDIALAEEAGAGVLARLGSGVRVTKPGAGGGGGMGGRLGPVAAEAAPRAARGGLAAAALRETAAASRPGRVNAPYGTGAGRPGRGGRLRSTVVPHSQLDRELDDYMQE